jgi:hypothetical protein
MLPMQESNPRFEIRILMSFQLDESAIQLSEKRESNPRFVALQATPNPLRFSHSLFPHLDSNQEHLP